MLGKQTASFPPPVPWGSMGQFGFSFGIWGANWRWLGLFYWEVKGFIGMGVISPKWGGEAGFGALRGASLWAQ